MSAFRLAVASCLTGVAVLAAPDPAKVTFNKDVLPILEKNCQSCHRPGEVAPMSLLSYSDARPWAKAIKAAVATRRMPPWLADPSVGHFENDRTLSAEDIATLTAWVDNGAREGDAKDKPAPLTFQNGWNIKPDIIVEMPKPFHVPATGTVNYKYILVKANFPEDMWVKAAEMRPGNSKVVHHGKVWVRPPGSHWLENAEPGEAYENETQRNIIGRNGAEEGNDILGKFNPGLGAQSFDIDGSAKFVPKGSDLVFELHYTTMGQATEDVSKIGLVLAKNPPQTRYFFNAGPTAGNLAIPAGDENAEVVSEVTVNQPAKLVYAQPHMHLRGKDFELRLIYPTGETANGSQDQVGFQLADRLRIRETDRHAEGNAHGGDLALRQLREQPLQSRSDERDRVGSAELGRDEQLLHRRDHRCPDETGDSVQAVGAELAAARTFRADISGSGSREAGRIAANERETAI